jgi:hypothetical protein
MAERHPYISSQTALVQVLDHLRRSFPATLNSDTLKKLGYAPGNESYTMSIAKYLKLVDENGTRQEEAHKIFTRHNDEEFRGGFSDLLRTAYWDLFELHHEAAWRLRDAPLITFFRQSDQSTELVGSRQASTFRTLAQYAGQLPNQESQKPEQNASVKRPPAKARVPKIVESGERGNGKISPLRVEGQTGGRTRGDVGLTVRIEVNLPSGGDQETYDNIFRSIRENLLYD